MTKNMDFLIVESEVGGTSEISFRATGVAEYWRSPEVEESGIGDSEKVFTKGEFEQALRKVSSKVKK